MFFRVHVLQGPGFSGSRLIKVQVFQGPGLVLEVSNLRKWWIECEVQLLLEITRDFKAKKAYAGIGRRRHKGRTNIKHS